MCVCMCVCAVYSGCPWGWRALPVILRSLLSLPTNTHKACHVDQVAAGPNPFVIVKSVHTNVWLYNCSLIFCLCLQCTTRPAAYKCPTVNLDAIVFLWLIISVWPVYYAVSVQKRRGRNFFLLQNHSWWTASMFTAERQTDRDFCGDRVTEDELHMQKFEYRESITTVFISPHCEV